MVGCCAQDASLKPQSRDHQGNGGGVAARRMPEPCCPCLSAWGATASAMHAMAHGGPKPADKPAHN